MPTQYNCIDGQSWTDVTLNTYGSMDYYVKGLADNDVSPNDQPKTAQVFSWDNQLVESETTSILIKRNQVKFATLTGYGIPDQPNPNTTMYKDPISTSYTATATDGETEITLTELQGNELVTVTKEIKQLKPSEYSFNATTGKITLLGGYILATDETLFVLYKKKTIV